MSKRKLSGAVSFLFGKGGDTHHGGKQRAAQPQSVAAFNAKVTHKFPEVEHAHTKGVGKRAHIGKHIPNISHLGLHFRINPNADPQHKGNGGGPEDKRKF